MKSLLYLALWNVEGEIEACGVSQKILTQARAFARLGYQTDVVMRRGTEFLLFHFPNGQKESWEMCSSKWLPQRKFFYTEVSDKLDLSGYNGFYIRYQLCDYYFWKLLCRIKKEKRKTAKIIAEMPTYPYGNECKGNVKKQVLYWQDQMFAPLLKRVINRMVTYDVYEEIYGVSTIRTQNGVDVDAYPVRYGVIPEQNVIRLVAIASSSPTHGYDRLLRGMAEYKAKHPGGTKFSFTFVGEGSQVGLYKQLARKLNLEKETIFVGRQPKEKLYQYVQQADIGVEVLAGFRVQASISSSLKSREYMAYGLPFITSMEVTGVGANFPWVLRVPNEETALNMEQVERFYQTICCAGSDHVAAQLHQYAKNNVNITQALQCIIDFLND